MKRRGTTDAIFNIRQIQTSEGNRKMYCAFIDLEKAYNRVPSDVVHMCLRKKDVIKKMVKMVMEMYRGARTMVWTKCRETEDFRVEVGLHQGSALGPFFFVMSMDVLTAEIRD